MDKKYDIFISYQRENFDCAKSITDELIERGHSVFLDAYSLTGSDFATVLVSHLEEASTYIFIYDAGTETSAFQRRQCETILELINSGYSKKSFIPIILSPIPEDSWFNKLRFYSPILISKNEILGKGLFNKLYPFLPIKGPEEQICPSPQRSKSYEKSRNLWKILKWATISIIIFITIVIAIVSLTFTNEGDETPNESCTSIPEHEYAIIDTIISDTIALDSIIIDIDTSESNGDIIYNDSVDSDIINIDEEHQYSNEADKYHKSESESHNYFIIILCLAVCGIIISIVMYRKKINSIKNLKLSVDKNCNIYLDGVLLTTIHAYDVYSTNLKKGRFILSIETVEDKKRKQIEIDIKNRKECQVMNIQFNSDRLFSQQKTIKVFIAGSTKLVEERDALRSTISKMYNKHKEDNLLIESYSFDDFPREYTIDGQQNLYDDFIRNEANWVVFITDGTIGDKTIWELEQAIKTHKEFGHPKIMIYSIPENITSEKSNEMSNFKRALNKENNYWFDYHNLDQIRTSFREHLESDIFNMLRKERNQNFK